jgi:hypothetical protein
MDITTNEARVVTVLASMRLIVLKAPGGPAVAARAVCRALEKAAREEGRVFVLPAVRWVLESSAGREASWQIQAWTVPGAVVSIERREP